MGHCLADVQNLSVQNLSLQNLDSGLCGDMESSGELSGTSWAMLCDIWPCSSRLMMESQPYLSWLVLPYLWPWVSQSSWPLLTDWVVAGQWQVQCNSFPGIVYELIPVRHRGWIKYISCRGRSKIPPIGWIYNMVWTQHVCLWQLLMLKLIKLQSAMWSLIV